MSDAAYLVKGKVALVTGAGSGIGHALTRLLLAAGCSVVLADLKLRPEAEQLLQEYPYHPTSTTTTDDGPPSSGAVATGALFHATDVTNWAQLTSLWETALTSFGRIDIVCSVAGTYEPPSSSFWKPPGISTESRDPPDAPLGQYRTFAVNQIAPMRLAQMAVDYWTQNRGIHGNFLAVASMAGYLHSVETPFYMASKAALVSFVKSLGALREVLGIRVSAVCPGTVLTPIFDPAWNKLLTAKDVCLSAEECAAVILRVLVEPQWGSGSIVETQMLGDKTAPRISVRDVQMEALYPATFQRPNHHVIQSRQNLIQRVQKFGMRG
ncbi:uncharacterized protein PG986_004296 [Apiospora aurea]|uniref:Uncharacterized protein n=1 Tax=Apiospora aurea TaxID=335848 RepID=A0ABR1QMN0_9PEZI